MTSFMQTKETWTKIESFFMAPKHAEKGKLPQTSGLAATIFCNSD